jgi:glycosyltransferase involved in cell wall biosynthesis
VQVLIVDPYLAGSHAAWAQEYADRSRHDIGILGLPGRHWKWRMHGGAVTLARLFLEGTYAPELIVATDMLDLATFLALTRERTAETPTVVYFHENQISYPWSEGDPDRTHERDVHYGFINLTSALAADAVAFNSEYHCTAFLDDLEVFLRAFPDYNEAGSLQVIRAKSRVMPLGLDLMRFDAFREERGIGAPALILWNHRWEYDKNPDDFFRVLFRLEDEGLDFEVVVMGKAFAEKPAVFDEARSRLGDRIVQFGYVADFADYASWLWLADILPVTSIQDFFGASVVQALYCDCCPVLPRRLAYPEHFRIGENGPAPEGGDKPVGDPAGFFYEDLGTLLDMLRQRIISIDETRKIRPQPFVRRYDWSVMAPIYDKFLEGVLEGVRS